MVIVKDIFNQLNKLADIRLAESWDNVGHLLGSTNHEVKNILICLDITLDVVKEAIEKNIDLIISHHPLIFKPLKSIVYEDYKGKILTDLIKNDISVISFHTNLDSAEKGLNHYLAEKLHLKNTNSLFENSTYPNNGLGKIGELDKEYTQEEFIDYLKNKLDLSYVRCSFGNKDKIKTVAILGGSGGSFIYDIPKVDVYLTGDIKYHEALDAKEFGKNIIDIEHFTEHFCKELFAEYLLSLEFSNEYNIILSNREESPFILR